ncbi:MAG: outer membrane lipoprotein carrier protein LolA [Geminicoccaceae bacterium]
MKAFHLSGLIVIGFLLSFPFPSDLGHAAVPKPGSVGALDIKRIETYLSDLETLRAHFTQLEPSGSTSSGNIYYAKPDKMRLDYDDPNPVLIVANGWQTIYHDRKLDQVTHLLTSQTPLAFLLEKKVELSGDVTVVDYEDAGNEIVVTLIQTDEPDLGSVQLAFAKDPIALKRWMVTDAQGLTTHIFLERSLADSKIDDRLFLLCDPDAVIKKAGCEY